MSKRDPKNYSEDMFEETRMSFGEHIEDLRKHLIKAILWFCFFVIISFFPFIGKNVLRFIAMPIEDELVKYWDKYYQVNSLKIRDELEKGDNDDLRKRNRPIPIDLRINRKQFFRSIGIADPKNPGKDPKMATVDMTLVVEPILDRIGLAEWMPSPKDGSPSWIELKTQMYKPLKFYAELHKNQIKIGRKPALSTLNVQEAFMVYFKVCLMTGFVLASPMVFYQIWSFVAAGLYPSEKKYVNVYMPFSIALFIIGVLVCEFLVLPKAIEALLWFNEWLGFEPDLRLNEWLGFAIFMPLLFGISFQTPLVMLFLERMRIVKVEKFRSARRMAWFLMAVFAAVASPSTDALSMLFLWVPMCMLYELGIWLCLWSPRRPELDIEVPESEEMVEV